VPPGRRALAGVLLCLLATLLACRMEEPDEGSPGEGTVAERERVVGAAREVATALSELAEVSDFAGKWTVCGSPPADAVEYAASGKLASGGDQSAAIDAATDALSGSGWTVTKEGTDPYRWVNLERDGVTASLRPDALRGSNAVAWAVAGDCLPVSEEQANQMDFKQEPLE